MSEVQAQLTKYYLNLLAKKDYSVRELQERASAKNYSAEIISEVLEFLRTKNYLNDQRLAKNLVEYYGPKKGRNWLQQKMREQKLNQETIDQALEDFAEEPDELLKDKMTIKYQIEDWQSIDTKTKQKILAFLTRQGYTRPYQILEQWQEV